MKMFVALLLALPVVIGCDSAPKPATPLVKEQAVPEKPALPPPPQPAPVDQGTVREVTTLYDKIKSECSARLNDLAERRNDETTIEYQRRIGSASRETAQCFAGWRSFAVGPGSVGLKSYDKPMAKFIRATGLTLRWDCWVFDIRRGPRGGDEILCSVTSKDDWSYAALGYLPKDHALKVGSLIKFDKLSTGGPVEGEDLKIRLMNLDNDRLNVLTFASVPK